jgi:predicted dehydrogenase
MTNPLRVGLIGTSGYAEMMHIPSIQSHPGAVLVAICGRDQERAASVAARHSVPQVTTDYRQMLHGKSIDAVVVATSDAMHYPITMAAIEAGLHVLCEKPLALTAPQAREMYEAAEAADIKHMVCFSNRWTPHFRYVRQLIDDGYLGRVLHCHIRCEAGYGRLDQSNWRFDQTNSRGILGDLGSHMIDLARWYVGDIGAVSAHLANYGVRIGASGTHRLPANDSAALLLEFVDGAQGTIHVSATAHVAQRGLDYQLVLYGEAGTLDINVSFVNVEVRGARHDEPEMRLLPVPDEYWHDLDRGEPMISQFWSIFQRQSAGPRAFIDAILENQYASPGFYEGFKAQEVIDAALRSHENRCWVTLEIGA